MTGIFPIERFRIKINYKLAYLLFKAAKYVSMFTRGVV